MLLSVLRSLIRRTPQSNAAQPPPSVQAWLRQGLEQQRRGAVGEAEAAFRRVLATEPNSADAAHLLGMLLHRTGRSPDAIAMLERAASLAPADAVIHLNLGSVHFAMGAPAQALMCFERAIRADPNLAAAHSNSGNVHKQHGDLDRAEQSYRRALSIAPGLAEAWHNLGNVQRDLGTEAESVASFERALAHDPGLLEARYSRALALLATGDLAGGWEAHECRFALPRRARDLRNFPFPHWQGEPLSEHRILVWSEQGIGDEILFAGIYADLIDRARTCVFECSAKLVPLFARSFPGAQVVARTEPPHPATRTGIDRQIAAGSLGRFLRTGLDDFPARSAYLVPPADRIEFWSGRLAQLGTGMKIGFSWRSSDVSGERALASSSLEQWGELLCVPGVHWIALQYDECSEELAQARRRFGVTLHRYQDVNYFDDLDEVSAMTAALDLVISAPNAVSVHAAALGVEVWQLAYGADWQTHGTAGTPWYPSLTRYARPWNQTWDDVLSRITVALRARIGAPEGRPHSGAPAAAVPVLSEALGRLQAGESDRAEALLREIVAADAAASDAWLLLTVILERSGREREAFECAQAAALAQPGFFEAHAKAGGLAGALGEFSAAIAHFRAAQALRPESADAGLALGDALERAGKSEAAIDAYRGATVRHPESHDGWLNLGRLLHRRGDLDAARLAAERAVAVRPDSAKANFNLGCVMKDQDALGPASEHLAAAVECDPAFAQARLVLGETLQHLGRFDRAEACYRHVLASEPESIDAQLHLGSLLFAAGRLDEALSLFSAIAQDAGSTSSGVSKSVARAAFNRALTRLGRGDFAGGWHDYEWRFHPEVRVASRHPLRHPFWLGEPLAGRTIVVWGEQGIGDEILFAGMYPELIAAAGHCIFECKAKLVSLFARSFPQATVIVRVEPARAAASNGVDFQVAAGSLGRYLRPSLASFPMRAGYLRAEPARVESWRERLAQLGPGLRVGFSWRSANTKGERALSCTDLAQWGPLFAIPGVHWIALQYDDCAAELAAARARFGVAMHRYDEVDYFDDLDAAAALTQALDLVISAPNAVSVHAAALGMEVWQMTFGADWQTHGTDGLPWYPTLRRFQRRWDQPWEAIIAHVANELGRRAAHTP